MLDILINKRRVEKSTKRKVRKLVRKIIERNREYEQISFPMTIYFVVGSAFVGSRS